MSEKKVQEVEYIYNTTYNKNDRMFNLVHCYEECGAISRVAKSCATKICNRYEIPILNGMVDKFYAEIVRKDYTERPNSSKYKEKMVSLMKKIESGDKVDIPRRIFEPLKNFSTVDPFQAIFLLEKVLSYAADNEYYSILRFYDKALFDMRNTIYED